ncbi:S8 family serine peptidase [Streptosporangium sp. KLBMP 9127]|nr:S8 family serine peptidase [Streptosporangium sp. KLBMP 9127]
MRDIAGGVRHRHFWNRFAPLAAALAVLLFCAPALSDTVPEGEETHCYIVMLEPTVRSTEAVAYDQVKAHDGKLVGVYRHAFNGYSATFTAAEAAKLKRAPGVLSVERDAVVTAFAQTVPSGVRRVFAPENRNLAIDGVDDIRVDVDVAVIDSGVDHDHPDLNVVSRADCTTGACVLNSGDDPNGHGSHVAGIVGAIDNGVGAVGVAPGARIHSVRVLDEQGSGTLSALAAAIDYVIARAQSIEVANLSLGCEGCSSTAISAALTGAIDNGVVVVAAAGNSATDASTFFPANHPDVITVSALTDLDGRAGGLGGDRPPCRPGQDRDDSLAATSNYGMTIEIAAPGTCIYSTWANGGYNTISGTSMASPHVAGAVGILAAAGDKPRNRADVQAIRQRLVNSGNQNWTDDAPDGVKEPLLDVHDAQQYAQNLL